MSHFARNIPEDLMFYLSARHACSYLPQCEAMTLFAEPDRALAAPSFNALSELGFRRSGKLVYTPRCPDCDACIPVRVRVDDFRPNRSQRRNWKRNADLVVAPLSSARFDESHTALFSRYIRDRHPGGSMEVSERDEIERFFLSDWSNTLIYEIHQEKRLVAVSVVDRLENGLSAVYTFFDPNEQQRGLGVYAVLALIEQTARLRLPYLYLGYLIHESPKMSYKANYRPQEQFRGGCWQCDEYP